MATARAKTSLIIGVGGHVVAIDPATGDELWRTKVKVGSYVTVRETADRIYAGSSGELFCLDRARGDILWRNKLKGLGLGTIAFTDTSDSIVAAAEAAQRAAAAAAG